MTVKKRRKMSEETKRKIGLANKKKTKDFWKNLTPKERKEKLSTPPFFQKGHTARVGLKHTPTALKKMSESHKGVPLSTRHRKALRGKTPHNKGKKGVSAETRRKMSESKKGQVPHNKGKKGLYKASKKTRAKISSALRKFNKENPDYGKKVRKGKTPYNKGKKGLYKASEETLKKKSLSMKKAWKVTKYRKVMKQHSDARKGKERSAETKRKISIKNLGSKRSEEARRKMREKRMHQKPQKKDTVPEKILQKLLDEMGIKYIKHKSILGQPDIFINPNICVFGDGDYYHANPKPFVYRGKKYLGYKPDELIWKNPQVLAKDKWARDEYVSKTLEERGYIVLRFWQSELEDNPKKCLQKIIKTINATK